jgi:5-methylcytosine-specific restriction endonuclease McrA
MRPCALHDRDNRPTASKRGYNAAWTRLRSAVIAERGGVCELDGQGPRYNDPLCVDHVVALARGGTNDRGNLVVMHRSENSRKAALTEGGFGR